jgi:hypothetical protein
MSLQNRVDPLGRLISTPARGGWMGNRGLLHDAGQRIRRPWRLKAWLICRLEFKGRRRSVMAPGLYTELFFLDEATALAAGHRPCAECRRADYNRFKAAAEEGRGLCYPRAGDLDAALQDDRLTIQGEKRTYGAAMASLPDGVFVLIDHRPWLKWRGQRHLWTSQGYGEIGALGQGEAEVLTPRLTVDALRAGFTPQVALS